MTNNDEIEKTSTPKKADKRKADTNMNNAPKKRNVEQTMDEITNATKTSTKETTTTPSNENKGRKKKNN